MQAETNHASRNVGCVSVRNACGADRNVGKRRRGVGCVVVRNACGADRKAGPNSSSSNRARQQRANNSCSAKHTLRHVGSRLRVQLEQNNPPTPITRTMCHGVARNICGVEPFCDATLCAMPAAQLYIRTGHDVERNACGVDLRSAT